MRHCPEQRNEKQRPRQLIPQGLLRKRDSDSNVFVDVPVPSQNMLRAHATLKTTARKICHFPKSRQSPCHIGQDGAHIAPYHDTWLSVHGCLK